MKFNIFGSKKQNNSVIDYSNMGMQELFPYVYEAYASSMEQQNMSPLSELEFASTTWKQQEVIEEILEDNPAAWRQYQIIMKLTDKPSVSKQSLSFQQEVGMQEQEMQRNIPNTNIPEKKEQKVPRNTGNQIETPVFPESLRKLVRESYHYESEDSSHDTELNGKSKEDVLTHILDYYGIAGVTEHAIKTIEVLFSQKDVISSDIQERVETLQASVKRKTMLLKQIAAFIHSSCGIPYEQLGDVLVANTDITKGEYCLLGLPKEDINVTVVKPIQESVEEVESELFNEESNEEPEIKMEMKDELKPHEEDTLQQNQEEIQTKQEDNQEEMTFNVGDIEDSEEEPPTEYVLKICTNKMADIAEYYKICEPYKETVEVMKELTEYNKAGNINPVAFIENSGIPLTMLDENELEGINFCLEYTTEDNVCVDYYEWKKYMEGKEYSLE